ncbi:hypothetical protein [Paenibacillus sp. 3LSP]|uniref:hypothetical protein n=1 Tax=Paenibacillus sp. 3LSP TaxID=2800795 RepID=UPI002905E3E0|nr:hypothetical protein [Paenibacillus sp. 3LSP]
MLKNGHLDVKVQFTKAQITLLERNRSMSDALLHFTGPKPAVTQEIKCTFAFECKKSPDFFKSGLKFAGLAAASGR